MEVTTVQASGQLFHLMAKFKVYKDNRGEYRWSLVSDKNGETIAVSSEGYTSKENAMHSVDWVKANANPAQVQVLVH